MVYRQEAGKRGCSFRVQNGRTPNDVGSKQLELAISESGSTPTNGGSETPKECRGDYVMKLAISSPDTIMRANAVECCASFLAHLGTEGR